MKIDLRNSFLVLFFIASLNNLNAQMVYMPDSMLRQKLTNLGYSACISGDSIDASCSLVVATTSLNLSYWSITNLQGIQAFTNLLSLNCSFNYTISNIPVLPNILRYLNCQRNNLQSLPTPLPDSLLELNCSENMNISSLLILPNKLQKLFCGNNNISGGLSLPATLTNFDCAVNHINYISFPLPPGLINFNCGGNNLTSFAPLPSTLIYFNCEHNSVTSIGTLPQGLTTFFCNNNQLTALPALPNSITYIKCENNLITTLPALPSSLQTLYCHNNLLTVLPAIPSSTIELNCSANNISNLPVLPSSLSWLSCRANPIDTLQPLPLGLNHLECDSCPLVSLPVLPSGLNYLDCSYCSLTVIPQLPSTITSLFCRGNQISSLPPLPGFMYNLNCSNNPLLFCIPAIHTIDILDFRFTGVSCLPGYGQIASCYPPLASFPLCDIFNANNCSFFWNIGGKTYFDSDTNCSQSSAEPHMVNMHINLFENGNLVQQAFTGGEGYYSFDVNAFGNYDVVLDTSNIPFTSVCPLTNMYSDTISSTDSLAPGNDFAMNCAGGFDIGVWSTFNESIRPAHHSSVSIRAGDIANNYGLHCAYGLNGALTITISGSAQYSGFNPGALAPSSVIGNVITYNIPDFGSINSLTDFAFDILCDTNAIPGSQVCFDISVSPVAGDNNPLNNNLTYCSTIVASYDPNEKEVYPAGIIDTSNHELTFTIHFQNTGTAPADNIYILDTLDNNIDLSSFQLLATSHQAYVQILDGGIARFNFPNINLPDSTSNEPASHGYVQYKVKLKDNLAIGTQIRNTAYIYFDFNAPVVTNTTLNTIDLNNNISKERNVSEIKVWPVPINSEFSFSYDQFSKNSHFSIINLIGDVVTSGTMNQSHITISTSDWPSGVYFLRVESANGLNMRKLIKN